MDLSAWYDSLNAWPSDAYRLVAPRVNVRGRMALILFLVVVWAFGWLLIRAYFVISTPNDVLVDKLGLDIPPVPITTLEEISSREIQINWIYADPQNSVQAHHVEVNGRVIGQTKKNEATATIHNLCPGTLYDVRVFAVSATRFQTPSLALHVRTLATTLGPNSEDCNDGQPFLRSYASKGTTSHITPAPTLMAREPSGGQPTARRGTTGRRMSPVYLTQDVQEDDGQRAGDEEPDGDLAHLSERFQKIQSDNEMLEAQIFEEEREHETAMQELERKRDELRQSLKERDELSNDLKKQVHKLETANRSAQTEKAKKEKLLQQKEGQRRKRGDEIARWDDQISSMEEEMLGIETQKTAIERRTQSELREIRQKIADEHRDLSALDDENKEKTEQIKHLEEERKIVNQADETEESREADRLDRERDALWQDKLQSLTSTYQNLWHHLSMAKEQYAVARERLVFLENTRRQNSISFASLAPVDADAARRGMKHVRRPRHGSSLASSMSSPRAVFVPELYTTSVPFSGAPNASPTSVTPFFNMANGTTMRVPEETATSPVDDLDSPEGAPMSPRAEVLLPADLLGDESADEIIYEPAGVETVLPLPPMRPTSIREEELEPRMSSLDSSSGKERSAPLESFDDRDSDSANSGKHSPDLGNAQNVQQGSRKLMSSLFSFNRQRGKTIVDDPPLLGTLKAGQSQSFPRKYDDLDPAQRPRRSSYGGNWAFPGNLLPRPSTNDKETRLPTTRRPLQSIFSSLGKGSNAPFDPFAARTNPLDADVRLETSSPRPSSTYSFDKLPRPSLESQFRAWAPERGGIRGSPLAPDWASTHSYSRSQSRRPSIHHGSASNLSLAAPGEEDIIDISRETPRQAPIGTRPASSQRPVTPKLNPAAPSFTTLFTRKADKPKERIRGKDKHKDIVPDGIEDASPPGSRRSKDTPSIALTSSTAESRESLERTSSAHSGFTSLDTTPAKPTFISKITRKASSNKFGSWKDKGGLFSKREPSTPIEGDEDNLSASDLGKSVESSASTPTGEDKKSSRASLSWNFIKKSKKVGAKEDLTASEVSESSERASAAGDEE